MTTTSAASSSSVHLAITTPSETTDDRSITIDGSLIDDTGTSTLGETVEVDEAGVPLASTSVGADGRWSAPVSLADLGPNSLTAKTVGTASEVVTSAPVVIDLQTVLSSSSSLTGSGAVARSVFPARGAEVSGDGAPLTFVFRAHPGHAVIDGFALSGAGADHLSLPHARFADVADVLRHTTMSGDAAVIHMSPRDSVTLVGVSKSALRADTGALQFHS